MRSFVVTFWGSWERMFLTKVRNCNATTTGSFTMTTLSFTSSSKQEFLTANSMTIVPHPLYSLDFAPSNFFIFQNKIEAQGATFWYGSGDSNRIADDTWQRFNKKTSKEHLKHGGSDEIATSMQKETTLKRMKTRFKLCKF